MPAYAYQALTADGQSRRGTIEADSPRSARSQLKAQQLVPLQVDLLGSADASTASLLQRPLFRRKRLNAAALSLWTRQLAGLIAAGLPLERALASLAEEAEEAPIRELVAMIRAEVNSGASFSSALVQHPQEFSSVYIAVIAAGEQGGQLGEVLSRLADDLEEQDTLKSKLISAALYPAIVTLIATAIVIFLVSYVVPQVATVFAGTHRSLPLLTVLMLAISQGVRDWGWLMLGLLIAGGITGRQLLKRPHLRLRFDAMWLTLPLVGRLARGYNAARFANTLALLAASGVPILRALQAAAETLSNQAMRADALDAMVQVREGAPLASALTQKKRFPGLLAMFSRLGEQTGQLPTMLERAAQQLSNDVQRRALRLATLLEPLLIVVMGLVVMLIVLAVLLPIIQMNQWVR
jgi:general secretion pathway protein F